MKKKHLKGNKKGISFDLTLAIVVMIVLGYIAITLTLKIGEFKHVMGEKEIGLLNSYNKAEKAAVFIESAGKMSAYQSIYDMAKKGGINGASECGTYLNNNLWIAELLDKDSGKKTAKECYPEAKKNFSLFMNERLNDIISSSKYDEEGVLIPGFDINVGAESPMAVKGSALKPMSVKIYSKEGSDEQFDIGEYSLRPNFQFSTKYDIGEYAKLEEGAKELINACGDKKDTEKCISEKTKEIFTAKGFASSDDCEKPEKKLTQSIASDYIDCINSENKECKCEIELDKNYGQKGEYKLIFDNDRVMLDGSKESFYVGPVQKLPSYMDFSQEKPVVIHAEDGKGNYKVTLELEYGDDSKLSKAELLLNGQTYTIEDGKLNLYRHESGVVGFVLPEDADKNKNAQTKKEVEECRKKAHAVLCLKSASMAFAYDEQDEKSLERDVVYKFALEIPDLPPKPLEGFSAANAKKDQGTVILKWKKAKEDDVASYNVYYSQEDFIATPIAGIIADINTNTEKKYYKASVSADVEDSAKFKSISFDEIPSYALENGAVAIKYKAVDKDGKDVQVKLEKGKLYYMEESDEMVYLLSGLDDDKNYYFAVTAVDRSLKEIDNVDEKQKLELGKNYANGASKDELAPGMINFKAEDGKNPGEVKLSWEKPLKNIDGSEMKDSSLKYLIYYQQKTDQIPKIGKLSVMTPVVTSNLEKTIAGLSAGQAYLFLVIAQDSYGNPTNDVLDELQTICYIDSESCNEKVIGALEVVVK